MPSQPSAPRLRVVQLNVGSLLEPHWDRRRHEVVAWLDHLDPDVVCLQEVWEDGNNGNTAEWLATRCRRRWHWCFGGFPFPDDLWPDDTMRFGSAIFSRWPIDHHELIALPVDESAPDPRDRLRSELLHARTAGLEVFSTHLVAAPAQAYHRVRQVLAIDDAVRARAPAARDAMPPIVCGDFNAEPPSDEMRYLVSHAVIDGRSTYYQDAWVVAGDGGPGMTQDPHRNPSYASMHLPPKRIDYVLVGDTFERRGAGVVERAEMAFDRPLTGILASDHFGLVVEVRWLQRPPD
jgi:endonuclease/exonuclease/phosphatase family metal-dependent hydrolase